MNEILGAIVGGLLVAAGMLLGELNDTMAYRREKREFAKRFHDAMDGPATVLPPAYGGQRLVSTNMIPPPRKTPPEPPPPPNGERP